MGNLHISLVNGRLVWANIAYLHGYGGLLCVNTLYTYIVNMNGRLTNGKAL